MSQYNDFYKPQESQDSGILIPDMAIYLQNNRQEGKWICGGIELDSVSFFALSLEQRISEYEGVKSLCGALWLTPYNCELKDGVAMYTIIRKQPLKSFMGTSMMLPRTPEGERSLDFREVIWCPKFVAKSAIIEGKPAKWFDIIWNFKLPQTKKDWDAYEQSLSFASSNLTSELIDWDLEARTQKISGMTKEEVGKLLGFSTTPELPPANEV